jgi:hypothetical protein
MVGVPPGLIYTTRESPPRKGVGYNLLAYLLICSEQSSFILEEILCSNARVIVGGSVCRVGATNPARHTRAHAAANSDMGLFRIRIDLPLLVSFIRPTTRHPRRAPIVWPRTYFWARVDPGDIHPPQALDL